MDQLVPRTTTPNGLLMCVDDDLEILETRRLLLESGGYRVVTSSSGPEALRILAQGTTVDLVLLDYLMPGMNGDELAAKLRQQYPHLPLVAISAVQLPTGFRKMTDAALQKGQDPEVLLSTISTVLAKPAMRNKGTTMQSSSEKTVLCVEDEEQELKLRKLLFESAGYHVLEARSAKAAIEAFRSEKVDAVVVDYWLCGENGTALAEEIKKLRPKTPVVMLSGFGPLPGEGTVVDSWMRKATVEPEELVNEVERLVALRSATPRGDKSE